MDDNDKKQINQDLFRYELIRDKYYLELEQLKDISNTGKTLFNTSIAILTIEITLITGLIIQNLEIFQKTNKYIINGIIAAIILISILTLISIFYFYKAKQLYEESIPIDIKDINKLYDEKKGIR